MVKSTVHNLTDIIIYEIIIAILQEESYKPLLVSLKNFIIRVHVVKLEWYITSKSSI